MTARSAPSIKRRRTASANAPDWRNALFVAPYLFFFVTLLVFPLFWGIWLSFHKADIFTNGPFIGLGNYLRLFNDAVFLQSVGNTFYFVLLTVPTLALLGLFLALSLNSNSRLATILRGLFFSSSVLSVTIVTLIWRFVFIPQYGLLSAIYKLFGSEVPSFLTDPNLAMIAIAITTIWWCIGLPMMLFLAALQQIPADIYEAAALDNASRWRTLISITLPSIRRTFVLVVIIQIVMQFQLFDQAWLMTRGGPNNTTRAIVLHIYDLAFRRWDVGMGAAASEVLFVLILAAATIQFLTSRSAGDRS